MRRRRGAQGGLGPYSQLSFRNDLQQSLIPQVAGGVATPTFTRATTASVSDFEGKVNTALSGESRFKGARRVEQLLTNTENFGGLAGAWDKSAAAVVTDNGDGSVTLTTSTAGVADIYFHGALGTAADAESFVSSVFMKDLTDASATCTIQVEGYAATTYKEASASSVASQITSSYQRFTVARTMSNALTTNLRCLVRLTRSGATDVSVTIKKPQAENTTGQANQNPSEYVSSGVGTGAELWANPAPTVQSPWVDDGDGVYSIDGSQGGTTTLLSQSPLNKVGISVAVSFDVTNYVAGVVRIAVGNTNSTGASANGSYSETLVTTATTFTNIQALASFDGTVSNISVKYASHGANIDAVQYFNTLNGNTVSDGTVADGPELFDGVFTTLAVGWSDSGGGAYACDGSQVSNSQIEASGFNNPSGELVTFEFTISDYVAGSIYPYSGSVGFGTARSANGTYTETITTGGTGGIIKLLADTSFIGTVSGVSVKAMSSDVVTETTGALINSSTAQFGELAGVSGDYFSTPDSAAADIASDIEFIAKIAPDEWDLAGFQVIIGKRSSGQASSYGIRISSGKLSLITFNLSSVAVVSESTVTTGFADGTAHWIKSTLSVSGDVSNFYTSEDGVTWTLLGDADIAHVSDGIQVGDSLVEVGSQTGGTANIFIGKIYSAKIYNGIDGTLAVDFNAGDYASGSTWDSSVDGVELVTNGDFATDSDWTFGDAGGSFSIASGVASFTRSVFGDRFYQQEPTAAGASYTFTIVVDSVASGTLRAKLNTGTTSGGTVLFQEASAGTYSITVEATNDDMYVVFDGASDGSSYSISSVSVKQVERWTINGNASIYQGYWDAKGPYGYMSEAAATNICLQSEDFSTTWSNIGATITQNQGTFIDGTNSFNKITDDSAGGTGNVYAQQALSITASVDMTFSVYVKADQLAFTCIRTSSYDAGANSLSWFNLTTGAVGTKGANHSASTIEALPNSVYRVSVTFQSVTDLDGTVHVYAADADGDTVVDLDGTSSILAGGAQVEVGSFPTAYIPTTTTAVTRNADVLTYDDVGNISDTAGTAVCEASTDWSVAPRDCMIVGRGSTNGRVIFAASTLAPTKVRSYDGANVSVSPEGTSMLHSPQPVASTWGADLVVYSPGTLQPDATVNDYDGAMGSGSLGVGCEADGSDQFNGTNRLLKIFSNEKSAAEVLLLG